MFELMILLVVIIMAWWLITGVAMFATHAFRRFRRARVAEASTEPVTGRTSPEAKSS